MVVQATAQRGESLVNQAAIDLLRRLPGITDANWRSVISGVTSLRELASLSIAELEPLLGSGRGARALHSFLHAVCPLTSDGGLSGLS